MADDKSPVGNPPSPADTEDDDQESPDSGKPKGVSHESYQKVLSEKKKFQAELKRLQDLEQKRSEEALAEQGKFKTLLEQREKELADATQRIKESTEREVYRSRMSAVVRGLGVADLSDKWINTVIASEIDQVEIDDDGKPLAASVQKFCEQLRKDWPEMVKTTPPNMPSGTPQGSKPNTIAYADWLKLPANESKKWNKSQIIG